MTMLTPHFARAEFACKCELNCGCDTVDHELLEVLEQLRDHYGLPVVITSAHRCQSHNVFVGGTINSQHLLGRAVDFKIPGVDIGDIWNHLEETYRDTLALGCYDTHIHMDTRSDGGTRWEL